MPAIKDEVINTLCSNLFDGAAYIFHAEPPDFFHSITQLLNSLPSELKRFAITLPKDHLNQGQNLVKVHLSKGPYLAAVVTLPQHELAVLIFERQPKNPFILFVESSSQPLTGLLMDKIAGAYRRARPRQIPTAEVSSPVCYSEQFNRLEAGVLIDGLAYLATVEDIATHDYLLNPAAYVI